MRAWVAVVVAAVAACFGPVVASAQPQAPSPRCALADERLAEVSGLVADGERWYAVNDGGTKSRVYVLTRDCEVERVITGATDPYDVEDLARGPDGAFWLADTGDNDKKRETVALIKLTPAGKTTLYRLTYPDGPHDTEAVLVDRAGVPHLVTKNPFGRAEVFRPAGNLVSPGPTALVAAGALSFRPTDTKGGPVSPSIGSTVVTGGAVSPDGTVVALRTYTDAYLYAAPDGDVVAAFGRQPVRVPLPDEPQGEAVALEPDGTLVSMSEGVGTPVRTVAGAAANLVPGPEPTSEAPPPASEQAQPTPVPAEPGSGAAGAEAGDDGLATLPAIGVTVVAVGGVLLLMHRRATRKG